MPKSTLALKAAVTRREPAPAVPPDLNERLQQLQHHQHQAAAPEPAELETSTKPETPAQDRKRDPHELQRGFLEANLNRPVTVHLVNGVKLIGPLQQFDQFTLLLDGQLVFKHAVCTIQPGTARSGRRPAEPATRE